MRCKDCNGEIRWNYFDKKNMCTECGNEILPNEIREGNEQRTLKEYIK